ncbi:hypothetical protein [Polyangium mundeleinium]|uniref:Uncharacterized protein n=1 Tax=Polyangium mundeleinium TaxID=2995306 RepID=A0ABT5EZH1_9BACT|nr:hypothetical protein [Polyangium mundeleinium]MDC0747244.1 hypothetical protein [Polyangium mundeleinium]
MPAPLAPLFGFALGVLLAWLARFEDSPDERGASSWDRPTLAVALYALLVYAPVSAYFAVFAADWSFAYLVDGRAIPSALQLLLVLLDAAAPVLGFLAGRRALARRSLAALAWLAALPLAAATIPLVALHARFGIDATYDQVQSDFGTRPLPGSPLGYAVLWMDVILVAGAVFTARTLSTIDASAELPARPGRPAPPVLPSEPLSEEPPRFLGRPRRPR